MLLVLQHADSFFPSGASAFSWGLEALCADGLVRDRSGVAEVLAGQIRDRWATCDRAFLVAAHRAHRDLDAVISLDRRLNIMTLPREMREGSRRAGSALLITHGRIGTPGAAAYRSHVRQAAAPGHLPVVQGLLWAGVGLNEATATAMALHGLCVSVASAAIRLSIISHVEAQQVIRSAHDAARAVLASPAPSVEEVLAYTPTADIAVMRHETQATRLFAN